MTKIMLNLPFYKNTGDGNQCAVIAIKIAAKHFLEKSYSLKKLDKLIGRPPGKWTWNEQIITGMDKIGLEAKYYGNVDVKKLLDGKKFILKRYGKSAKKILSKINLPAVKRSAKYVIKNNLVEKRKLTPREIEAHIKKGHIAVLPVNWNIIKKRKGLYQGHMLVLTGFDKNNIYCHNSGPHNPEKNMKINKKLFLKGWNAPEISSDIIIVFGKKNTTP